MATTYTDNLNLNLPEVGASRDTWGALLNQNFTTLDGAVAQAMPIGCVIDFAGQAAPAGWLICDGRQVSRTTYSDLFAAIGAAWGAGDGSTTFNLPNTSGRASVGTGVVTDQAGASIGFTFGELAGVVNNTILQTHLPDCSLTVSTVADHSHYNTTAGGGDHTHTVDVPNASALSVATPGNLGGVWSTNAGMTTVTTSYVSQHVHTIAPDGAHAHTVSLGGSGAPIEVLSPIIVMTKIIYAGQQAA